LLLIADLDHIDCNRDQPEGCTRCRVTLPSICCDIHNAGDFMSYTSDSIAKPMRAPQRSHLPQYTHCKQDFLLIDALEDWREMKTTVVHGWTSLRDLGPSLIMTNATLEWIVDCAHHHKILSVQDMRRETGWPGADQFGLEIIAIIQKHAAPLPSPFVSSLLRPAITTAPDATRSHLTAPSLATNSSPCQLQMPGLPTRHRSKCSACGQEGHNCKIYWSPMSVS